MDGLINLAGNSLPPGFTASKILWLKQNEPKNFKALKSVLLPHDYVNFYLTGEKAMEFGDASGTGLLNVRTKEWCTPIIEFIDEGLEECLPPLGSSRRAVGLRGCGGRRLEADGHHAARDAARSGQVNC